MKQQFKLIGYWLLRIIAAFLMLQTLVFKFSGAPESIYIFSTIGMEPWGRITTGVLESIASILLLLRNFVFWGSLLGLGLMSGALFFHLTALGIEVQGDGGQLFLYACIVFLCCLILLFQFSSQAMAPFRKKKF